MNPDRILKGFLEQENETSARVAEGIERNRKSDAAVRFVGPDGSPQRGLRIRVRQTRHAFKHGANLFMLGGFEDPACEAAYRDHFAEAFNLATLPFYWSDLESEPGKKRYAIDAPKVYRRPTPDLCLDFCERRGIEPKAHCLNYQKTTPAWAHGSPDREWALLEEHFADLAGRYASRIPMWEVTNELYWKMDFGSSIYKSRDFLEKNFRLAAKYFPSNHLISNEWSGVWGLFDIYQGFLSSYFLNLENALLRGARIDSVGLQFHLFCEREKYTETTDALLNPAQLFKVMDCYAALGLPLQVTEVTIPAWDDSPEAEALQGEIVRRLYEIWFSHPAMEAVVYWNLPDGFGFDAAPGDFSAGENIYRGGLVHHDLSPKPAFTAIRDLFGKTWRTDQVVETDADGILRFRGFLGDYELLSENGEFPSVPFTLDKSPRSRVPEIRLSAR